MDKLRLVYAQTGRARWISHLDAMRTLQRGLLRAGVPLRYSEGFNPHALISIVMPLSVGTESMCQMADIRVREDIVLSSLPERLTAVMPEGLRFTDAYEDFDKPAELKWLEAEGLDAYDMPVLPCLPAWFFVLAERRTIGNTHCCPCHTGGGAGIGGDAQFSAS